MKRLLIVPVMATILSAQPSFANVGFDMNVNIGNGGGRQPAPVIVPAPVVVPPPAPVYVDVEAPPEFIIPSALGFYVAVGVPYDLFYIPIHTISTAITPGIVPQAITAHGQLPPIADFLTDFAATISNEFTLSEMKNTAAIVETEIIIAEKRFRPRSMKQKSTGKQNENK